MHGAGGLVLAAADRVIVADAAGETQAEVVVPLETVNARFNDGACGPDGRFYIGSMATDRTPKAGKLFRMDQDLSVDVVFSDVTVSNGLGFSPDGRTAYYADTPTMRVRRYTPDGALDRRIEVPVDRVTSCAFGRAGLGTLFVTTASFGLDPDEHARQPLAGSLFAVDVGLRGMAAPTFGATG